MIGSLRAFTHDVVQTGMMAFAEAVEFFFQDYRTRRNNSFRDRYQLIGTTLVGRYVKIIFQLKAGNEVRIITG